MGAVLALFNVSGYFQYFQFRKKEVKYFVEAPKDDHLYLSAREHYLGE